MSTTYDFDRLVEGWLQAESPREMSAAALDEALRSARRLPQRRGVRAWFAGSGAWPAERQFGALAVPNGLRLALVLALLLSAVVLAALVGARLLAPDPVPPGALVYATDGGLFIADRRLHPAGHPNRWYLPGPALVAARRLHRGASPAPLGHPARPAELLIVRPDGVMTRESTATAPGLDGFRRGGCFLAGRAKGGLIAPSRGRPNRARWCWSAEGTGLRLEDEPHGTVTARSVGSRILVYSARHAGPRPLRLRPLAAARRGGHLITPPVTLGGNGKAVSARREPGGTDVAFLEWIRRSASTAPCSSPR